MSLRLWLERHRARVLLRLAERNVSRVCTIDAIEEGAGETTVIVSNERGPYDDRRQRVLDYLTARRAYANACEAWQHAHD